MAAAAAAAAGLQEERPRQLYAGQVAEQGLMGALRISDEGNSLGLGSRQGSTKVSEARLAASGGLQQ